MKFADGKVPQNLWNIHPSKITACIFMVKHWWSKNNTMVRSPFDDFLFFIRKLKWRWAGHYHYSLLLKWVVKSTTRRLWSTSDVQSSFNFPTKTVARCLFGMLASCLKNSENVNLWGVDSTNFPVYQTLLGTFTVHEVLYYSCHLENWTACVHRHHYSD